MSAVHKSRRKVTAREGAEQLGVSTRTVQRIVAEPRGEYLSRSHARQDLALQLKNDGLKYREIAERIGTTERAAQGLVERARKRRMVAPPIQSHSDALLPGQTSIEDVSGE